MKKKRILLILPISFFLCSCNISEFGIGQFKPFSSEFWQGLTIFGWKPFGGKNSNDSSGDSIDDVEVDENKHANSIEIEDPKGGSCYLKKDEKKVLKVKISPVPTRDLEKEFTWKITKGDGISIPSDVKDASIEVTGVKESTGNVITVTNDYNPSLTKSFTINVIDFDEENDYLWQYNSEVDKAKFGYTSEKKEGNASGEALLNGINWSYLREPRAISLNLNQGGCIGFGRGEEPETHIQFEADTERSVKSVIVECASANSQAKMSISVGETAYMTDKEVPKISNNALTFLVTDEVEPAASGKIKIDVVTPEFDAIKKEEDPDYRAPGCFYIKSILIRFSDSIEPATVETFDFKDLYDNREKGDGVFGDLNTTDWKEVKFSQNEFDITLEKVKKESDKVVGYATTSGYIDIKFTKPGEEIYKVEFKFEYGTTGESYKNIYSLEISKSGGAPYTSLNIESSKENEILNASLFKNYHPNSIRLSPSKVNAIGLNYLKISTKAGINPTIASITPPDVFVPDVTSYNEGDLFDTSGLGDLTISYAETGVESDVLPAAELEWFDGASYDEDATTATKELQAGTTKVYGIFRGEEVVTIEGITVSGETASLTLVKDASEIVANHKYLIVGQYNDGFSCINGEKTGSDDIKDGFIMKGFALSDNVEVSKSMESRAFIASFDVNSKLLFENSNGNKIGLTKSGSLSCTTSPALLGWDYEINSSNQLVMTMVDQEATPTTKEFGVNKTSGKYSAYSVGSSSKGAIYLYEFA